MAPSAIAEVDTASQIEAKKPIAEDKGLELTPLEAISQGDVLPGIPTFPSFAAERRHTLVHMAAVFRYFARQGFTEGQSGHISVVDPEFPGRLMWMNPLSRHFGMLTAGDMLCLDMETGKVVWGGVNAATGGLRTANSAGFLIHGAVHRARPDARAVAHAHTVAGRAWSAFARPLDMITQDVCNFYGDALAVYARYGGIVFAAEEGERIAAALGPRGRAGILLNHGLLTVGATVDEAGFMFGLLDRCCAVQLAVEAACAGNPALERRVIPDEEAAYNFRMASEKHALYREAQPDVELEIEAAGGEEALARGFADLVFSP